MVWCGLLAPKTLKALAVVLHEERRLIFQHPLKFGVLLVRLKNCRLAVVPDIAIQEMMLMKIKQDDMPQHLVLCTDMLS